MAAVLTVTPVTRTNRPIAISGTGFTASATVTITIDGNVAGQVVADLSGNWNASPVLSWYAPEVGKYTVVASDGTNRKTAEVQVYATT